MLVAVAVAGLTLALGGSAGATSPPPNPTQVGATTLSNIELNGLPGTIINIAPGTDVTISANWSDNNTGCTGCVDYVAVGWPGHQQAGCIEALGRFGSSGSGTVDLGPAPTAPGTYDIVASFEEVYYCGQSWTTGASPGYQVIAQVVIPGPSAPPLKRIYGTDAIATAIAVSQHEYQAGSAGAVVLARTTYFSDALAGGPFAAAMHAPLLLTEGAPKSATIDRRVLSEIERVLPKGDTVYILGGPLALSPNIDTALQGVGYKTTRIAGADEYATTVDIAEALGNPSTVFETTGLSFADSLSAGPAAIKTHGAILLTDGATQSPETAAYLAAHPGDTRYAVGGPLAAYGADPTAIPVYGQTLFGTSAAVAKRFFPDPSTFGVAAAWQDALAGGPFLGARGPLLVVPAHPPLPSPIVSYLSRLAGPQGYVFGGPLAVSQSVVTAVRAAEG